MGFSRAEAEFLHQHLDKLRAETAGLLADKRINGFEKLEADGACDRSLLEIPHSKYCCGYLAKLEEKVQPVKLEPLQFSKPTLRKVSRAEAQKLALAGAVVRWPEDVNANWAEIVEYKEQL